MYLRLALGKAMSSKIALTLLQLHRAFFIMVDDAVFPLRAAERNHLLDNFWNGVSGGANGSRARNAAKRAHAALDRLRRLAGKELRNAVNENQRTAANHHFPLLGEIQWHDRNLLHMDVQPDIQLRPIGQGKHANAFVLLDSRIEQVPEFRP